MSVYIVSKSEHYYPCGGTFDWVGVSIDRSEADDLYEEHAAGATACSLYLIEVEADGSYSTLRSEYYG